MKRRAYCLILALMLLFGLCLPVQAADTEEKTAADALNTLGLFNGVGTNPDGTPNYALDRTPNRQEGITMLVRLLGKETEALAGDWETPFTDVDTWALPYVGYAYSTGLTRGTGETTFGSKDTFTASQYITFVLRALGWSSDTDFAWDRAWEKSDELGITDGRYNAQTNAAFLRGDIAIISAGALRAAVKGSEESLLDSLIAADAVTQEAAQISGLLPDACTRFARELLAMEYTEVTIPFGGEKKNAISTTMLNPHVGQHDFYIAYGTVGTTVAAEAESMLCKALMEYSKHCMDGNYTHNDREDWGITTVTMGIMEWPSCLLVTNRKGMVIGYALWEYGAAEFTLRMCEKDSKPLMDNVVADMNAMLDSLPRIEGTMDVANGKWIFQFHELPESAVWIVNPNWSYKSEGSVRDYRHSVRDVLVAQYNAVQSNPENCISVFNPYAIPPFFEVEYAGTLRTVILFLNADYQPVAYTCIIRDF